MAGEAHITTIGVRQAHQRQGIGELLLISTIDIALMRNAQVMTLEMRLSNSAAQALYKKYGFTKRGVRRGYYTDNREDAVIMTTDTLTSALFQTQFQHLKRAHAERWGPALCQLD
jgi:ribosomal-protein-alanine N-acetyltransferase